MTLEPGKFELTPENHAKLVSNLLKRTKEISPEHVAGGKTWYPEGQKDSSYIGQELSGRDTESGAAILGKLSASTEWRVNRMMGLQIPTISDKQFGLIKKGAEISKEARSIKGSKEEAQPEKDIAKDETNQIRRVAGLGGTPLNNQTLENVHQALRVRNNEVENPMSIFTQKETGANKTPDFAKTLATGGKHNLAVIDTHAYDAALNSYHVPYGVANTHLAKKGVYSFLQNAYAEAHQKALKQKLIPEDTSVGDFQAMHWVHHNINKAKLNENAGRSAKAGDTRLVNLLKNNPHLNPASHGLSPIVIGGQPVLGTRSEAFKLGGAER